MTATATQLDPQQTHAAEAQREGWQFKILIDGDCPLCVKEARFLRRLDGGRGRLKIIDITAPDFEAADYGVSFDEVMGSIHGVTRDGSVLHGFGVFREAYGVIGWGWLVGWTGWPVFKPLVDRFYRWFAANRLRITGRGGECENGRCKI